VGRRNARLVIGAVVAALLVALAGCGNDDPSPATDRACPAADDADLSEVSQARAELLLGYSEADAQRCAETLGWGFRVGERDGEPFALTMDYRFNRVNVVVNDDIVTAISVG